jgi:hypothetical protein
MWFLHHFFHGLPLRFPSPNQLYPYPRVLSGPSAAVQWCICCRDFPCGLNVHRVLFPPAAVVCDCESSSLRPLVRCALMLLLPPQLSLCSPLPHCSLVHNLLAIKHAVRLVTAAEKKTESGKKHTSCADVTRILALLFASFEHDRRRTHAAVVQAIRCERSRVAACHTLCVCSLLVQSAAVPARLCSPMAAGPRRVLSVAVICAVAVALVGRVQADACLGEFQVCGGGDCVLDASLCGRCANGQYLCPDTTSCVDGAQFYTGCPGLQGTHFDWVCTAPHHTAPHSTALPRQTDHCRNSAITLPPSNVVPVHCHVR